MKFINKKTVALGGVITALVLAAGTGGAVAGSLVTSKDIKDGTIKQVDIKPSLVEKFSQPGEQGPEGPKGDTGATGQQGPRGYTGDAGKDGADGRDGLDGAVYRTMTYNNGGGGSATVACADDATESQRYTAISGGVQGDTVADQGEDGFAITASFPGRMNWDTNEPRENRLDGWIVLGNGEYTETLTVWALCVPTTSIPVDAGFLDN